MIRRIFLWLIGGLVLTVMSAFVYDHAIAPTLYAPTPTPIPVPTKVDLPHLPTFAPSYPCELEKAEVHDDATCYYERVEETEAARTGTSVLIVRKEHVGSGCFGSISSDTQSLQRCDRHDGVRAPLLDHVIGELNPSPDGAWLAVTTLQWVKQSETDGGTPALGVYKVRRDGSDLTRLDTQGFPRGTVGINVLHWEANGDWLDVSLWDGTESGWHPHRLKTDGSGVIGPNAAPTPLPPGEG